MNTKIEIKLVADPGNGRTVVASRFRHALLEMIAQYKRDLPEEPEMALTWKQMDASYETTISGSLVSSRIS